MGQLYFFIPIGACILLGMAAMYVVLTSERVKVPPILRGGIAIFLFVFISAVGLISTMFSTGTTDPGLIGMFWIPTSFLLVTSWTGYLVFKCSQSNPDNQNLDRDPVQFEHESNETKALLKDYAEREVLTKKTANATRKKILYRAFVNHQTVEEIATKMNMNPFEVLSIVLAHKKTHEPSDDDKATGRHSAS